MDLTNIVALMEEEVLAKKEDKPIANFTLITKNLSSISLTSTPKKQGKGSLDSYIPTDIIMMIFDCLKHVALASSWCLALTNHRFFEIFDIHYRSHLNFYELREIRDDENLYGVMRISVPLYKLLDGWMGPGLVWNEWKSKFTTRRVLEDEDEEGLFSGGSGKFGGRCSHSVGMKS